MNAQIKLVGLPLICVEQINGFTPDYRQLQKSLRVFNGVKDSITERLHTQAGQYFKGLFFSIAEQLNKDVLNSMNSALNVKDFNDFGFLEVPFSVENLEADCLIFGGNGEKVKATYKEIGFALNYITWAEISKSPSLDENKDYIQFINREELKNFSKFMANYLNDYLFKYDQHNSFDYIYTEKFIQDNFGISDQAQKDWKEYSTTVKEMPNAIRSEVVKKIINNH